MTESKYEFQIEAEGKGFVSCPLFDSDFELPTDFLSRPDLTCAYALDRAKRGDFRLIPSVAEFCTESWGPIIDRMALGTVASAGSARCYSQIVDVVQSNHDLGEILDFCGAMAVRGELSYVPIFLEKYIANAADHDAEYLLDYAEDLMGDDLLAVDHDPDDKFGDQVMESYRMMVERLGSERALVFRGQLYTVKNLAEYTLETVRHPYFLSSLRLQFEGATGIDCSSWYKDRRLQPLAATATLEGFLESGEADKYEPGVRYFFGHRIPD